MDRILNELTGFNQEIKKTVTNYHQTFQTFKSQIKTKKETFVVLDDQGGPSTPQSKKLTMRTYRCSTPTVDTYSLTTNGHEYDL